MTGPERNETQGSQPSWTPAPFEKRVAAWVGVAYMVILVLSTTYMIATASTLTGTAGLLLCPAAIGAGVIALHRWRQGRTSPALGVLQAAVCLAACIIGLAMGVPSLLDHLKGLFA